MNVRHLKLGVLTVVCTATLAGGGVFFWDGNGGNDDFDTCGNWLTIGIGGGACFPDDCRDDAMIGTCGATCPWFVNLIDEKIDDLPLLDDVDFDAVAGATEGLAVDTLTIDGGTGGTMITATHAARIRATGGCVSP